MFGNKIPSFFKTPKTRQFEYKPRYYNPTKERLEEQEKRVLREMEYEKKLAKNDELRLREQMKDKWNVNSRKEANQKANKRVMIIAIVLITLAYYFLYK